jgi:predicted O-methyltransferase YrrM
MTHELKICAATRWLIRRLPGTKEGGPGGAAREILRAQRCRGCHMRTHPLRRPARVTRAFFAAGAFLALTLAALSLSASAHGDSDIEAQFEQRLAWMRENQTGMWNVSPREGLYLYNLVVKHHLKRGLEIGTSNGYSGIWIASGMRVTRGHLLSLEIDAERAALARDNFQAAGVKPYVTLQEGDALKVIPGLAGPFDFVFLDAGKPDYLSYLKMVLPKVSPGGLIVAHNVIDMSSELQDYIRRVETDPQLKTRIVDPGPGGFSVSIKVRKR